MIRYENGTELGEIIKDGNYQELFLFVFIQVLSRVRYDAAIA